MVPESLSLSELENKYATDSESNEPNSLDSQPAVNDKKERKKESKRDSGEEEDEDEYDEEESEDEEVISALEWVDFRDGKS